MPDPVPPEEARWVVYPTSLGLHRAQPVEPGVSLSRFPGELVCPVAELDAVRAERDRYRDALTLAALNLEYDEPDDEHVDALTRRGLVQHGRDFTGEGYCHPTREGVALIRAVLAGDRREGENDGT